MVLESFVRTCQGQKGNEKKRENKELDDFIFTICFTSWF